MWPELGNDTVSLNSSFRVFRLARIRPVTASVSTNLESSVWPELGLVTAIVKSQFRVFSLISVRPCYSKCKQSIYDLY